MIPESEKPNISSLAEVEKELNQMVQFKCNKQGHEGAVDKMCVDEDCDPESE